MHQQSWIDQFMAMDMAHLGIVIALVSIIGAILMIVLIVATVQWRKVRVADTEANLKMQMLEQGMSAADIQTVIDAGRRKRFGWHQIADEFRRDRNKVRC